MIKHIFLTALFITIAFILNLVPPINEKNELVPLKIGNSWSFKVTTYDTLGSVAWIDTLTFFIKKDTVINNLVWYLQGFEGTMIGKLGFLNDSLGYHISNFEGYSELFPYPAEVGESMAGITVVAKDSVVQTPLGKVNCYIYRQYFFGYSYYNIYAPGIGLIYQETPGKPFSSNKIYLSQTSELISTNVKTQ